MKTCSLSVRPTVGKYLTLSRFAAILRIGAVVAAILPAVAFGQNNARNTGAADGRSAVNSRIGTLRGLPNNAANAQRGANAAPAPSARPNTPAAGRQTAAIRQPQAAGTQPGAADVKQQESCLMTSSRKAGTVDVVEVTLEGSGDVLQTNQAGQYERAGIEFVAGFKYEELFETYSPTGAIRSLRQYEQAGMKRKFGSTITRPLLDRSRQNVASVFDGKKITLYSPAGPMKAEQYALLSEAPFNTTLLDRLLPNRQVKLGDVWQIPTDVLAAMLGVDAVQNNTVNLTLTSIVDNFAEVELYQQGGKDAKGNDLPSTMECASEGASIGLDLNGKFQFDLAARRITWFGLRISERRSESVATPGLECNVTLKINVAPLEKPEKLTEDVVAKFKGGPTPEQLRLYYNAQKGPWKFQHSRRWKMIEDSKNVTALCYVDRGEAVAQCNILSNGKIDLSTQPTLNSYKDEIQKGLGDRFAEFKKESAYRTDDGLTILYVVADGAYESIPFRWVYYLVTDEDGNQATIMFEIRGDLLERYDESGAEIVESFKLTPRVAATVSPGKTDGQDGAKEKGEAKTDAELDEPPLPQTDKTAAARRETVKPAAKPIAKTASKQTAKPK